MQMDSVLSTLQLVTVAVFDVDAGDTVIVCSSGGQKHRVRAVMDLKRYGSYQ